MTRLSTIVLVVDGDGLTYIVVDSPSHGTVGMEENGSFSYGADEHYVGTDSFTFKVNDGQVDSNTATVTITVTNQAPIALPSRGSIVHDKPLTASVDAADFDGDELTFSLAGNGGASSGTVDLHADGSYTYAPNAGFVGSDSFTFIVSDGVSTSRATVAITVTNQVSVATNTSLSGPRNSALEGNVSATDPDDDSLRYSVASDPSHGTVTMNTDGSFSYIPNLDWYGTDSFTFKANDGVADSNTATVTLNVSRYPMTVKSKASVSWHYAPSTLTDWLGGQNSVSLSISAVTENGVNFEGPPVVEMNATDRFANSRTLIKDATAVLFTRTVNGVAIQGYQVTVDIKWTYSKVFLLNAFGVVPDWIDTVFGYGDLGLNVEMETSITLEIMANGTVASPIITNTSESPHFQADTTSSP